MLYFTNPEGIQECEMKPRDEISPQKMVLTLPNNLPFDCKWNVTIETRTTLDRVNTTGEITISKPVLCNCNCNWFSCITPHMLAYNILAGKSL